MEAGFQWTFDNAWFWAGAIVLTIILCLSLWNLHRRDWQWRHCLLEGFRLLLAAAIVLALAKPETRQRITPDEPTRFLVLTDRSASMETKDMPLADGQTVSRREWLEKHQAWQESLGPGVALETLDFEAPESGQTDLHTALMDAAERHGKLGGIVLLSDGDWNSGESPDDAALTLRRKGIPLITVPVGRETALPDITLTWLPMPKTLVVDEPVRLPFRLENRFSRPVEITVTFEAGGQTVETMSIPLDVGEILEEAFLWKPSQEGQYELTVSTPVLPGEARDDNNAAESQVTVREERLQVLLVDSAPRWEFRYLRNALMRDPGVDLSCVLFHPHPELGLGQGPGYLDAFPGSMETLTSFDVVFLGDVGVGDAGQLTTEQAQWLRGLVERQASGLVFLPGRRGHQQSQSFIDSALGELLPVVWDETAPPSGIQEPRPATLELTAEGRQSVLTLLGENEDENAAVWRSLPGFYWHAPVSRAKAGATILAVHESSRNRYGRLPLLVTRPFGSGKVLFLGTDGAWRWRRGVEDLYHYRFWSQVARWMAYQRNLAESDRGRIIHYPEAPLAGRETTIHATLLGPDRGPLTGASPVLTWTHDGESDSATGRLPLTETEGDWGVYRGSWVPPRGGLYQLAVGVPGESWNLTATLEIEEPLREATGDPARPEVLRRLAETAQGHFLNTASIMALPEVLTPLAEAEPIMIRHQWWRHPGLLILLIIGLSVYWIARKRLGLV